MKICLISPPTATEHEEAVVVESEGIRVFAEHAPIGILTLAAVLEQHDLVPQIVDLNRLYYRYLKSEMNVQYGSLVADYLASLQCDIYGFGNCVTVTRLQSESLKNLRANALHQPSFSAGHRRQ